MNRQDLYVAEKLSELDAHRFHPPVLPEEPSERKLRLLGPIVRATGHRMRHLGEALERWASPPVARDACE